jgi:outer membrane protein assembly factor BamB
MKVIKNSLLLALLLTAVTPFVSAQTKAKSEKLSATPCLDVLNLFTAANVPAMAPQEEPSLIIHPGEEPSANLPGKGLAQHAMLYVGENNTRMALINDGKVIWTYQTGKGWEYDDVWMASNGNILFTRMKYVAVLTPDKRVLWKKDFPENGADHAEVHTCQPIGLDRIMFVVNADTPKLYIVNYKTGKTEFEHEIPYENADLRGVHGQFRRARVTAQGTYLLSYLSKGKVVEYDKDFKEIWSYQTPKPWAAIRLKNGNTLITDENEWRTFEVNPKKETVWEFNCKTDLPAQYQLASAPQTCTRLANGNTIFTSRGQNGKGPQMIEVTRDKKVVWVLHDWKSVGDGTAVQVLDDPGVPEIPGQSEH